MSRWRETAQEQNPRTFGEKRLEGMTFNYHNSLLTNIWISQYICNTGAIVPEIVMKMIYLLSTDHLEDSLWFRDEEDFKVAMNYVAIQAVCCRDVSVLAFILMSNHVHFILRGTRMDVLYFLNGFKHRYSIYLRRKYGLKKFLRLNDVDVKPIPYEDEAPERAIAYVQMNSVAANICSHPSQWPWGTGNTFFNQTKLGGRSVGSLSHRAIGILFHSDFDGLPEDWTICDEGYIPPQMYVDVEAVEECFRSPNRMNYFLNNSSKAKKRLESAGKNLPSFRDQSILAIMPDLCRSLFQKKSFAELNEDEQSEFARQIRYRFSADANQIARVCGVSYATAARLLDRE